MKVRPAIVCAALVINATAASGEVGERAEDSSAESRIQKRLRADPDLKHDDIEVHVKNGVATLRGRVDSQSEHARAEELAHVDGVARIDDQLKGGRTHGSLQAVSDATVSLKLRTQYGNDKGLKHGHIAVTTTDGVVTLSGSVPSERARRHAIASARATSGVKQVTDKLEVVPPRQ